MALIILKYYIVLFLKTRNKNFHEKYVNQRKLTWKEADRKNIGKREKKRKIHKKLNNGNKHLYFYFLL